MKKDKCNIKYDYRLRKKGGFEKLCNEQSAHYFGGK